MKDAETPVFTRVFGVFYIRTAKILVAKSISISKRISKNFLEIFLEMGSRLCGSRRRVTKTTVHFSADIIAQNREIFK